MRAAIPLPPANKNSRRASALANLFKKPIALIALFCIVSITALVAFADFFAPADPAATDLTQLTLPPSAAHPLGTDTAGRDELSRVLHGGQITLLGALTVLLVALVVGVTSGLIAGYFGKIFDSTGSWLISLVMSLPLMVVLLAVRAGIGPNILAIMATLGFLLTPAFYLLVRSSVRAIRNELYVDAARVAGLSDFRIIYRHVLTAIRAPLIIQSMMVASMSIGIQAALDFLGLGVTSGPTWGGLLNESFMRVYDAPQLMLWPGLVIGIMTASLLVLGNYIRDAVEDRPRLKINMRMAKMAKINSQVGVPLVDGDAALSINDLRVSYQTQSDGVREVVHGVSLKVRLGKVTGLVGESGSGKSQIAFSILGLLPESAIINEGTISFDGLNLLSLSAEARRKTRIGGIAYIPQEPMANLDPSFTVGDQLMEPLRFARGMSKVRARESALKLLRDVAIDNADEVINRYPHEISGGMAQRVLIAAALAMDPRVLVADEPTTALDVTVQAGILKLLRDLQKSRGLSVLLVTHDLGVAAEMCDDLVVLRDGEVIESGSVEDIFYQPKAEYTKSLLEASFADAKPRPRWKMQETKNLK